MSEKTYYTTTPLKDDGLDEEQHAPILVADSREAAEAAIARCYRDFYGEGQAATLEFDEVMWGDCWFRAYDRETAERHEAEGVDDGGVIVPVTVQSPGTHPGGNCWWVTPSVEVLAARIIEKEVSNQEA